MDAGLCQNNHRPFETAAKGGENMATGAKPVKGKCSENPPRREPMTVKIGGYRREDGTYVEPHKRHKPK